MRVVLAVGPEKKWAEGFARVGVKSARISYYYFEGKDISAAEETLRVYKDAGIWVMIDSGAHSFAGAYSWLDTRRSSASKQAGTLTPEYYARLEAGLPVDPKECLDEIGQYVSRYMAWVKRFRDAGLISAWAELDINALVGMEPVREWRSWWVREGLADNLIVTVHPGRADAGEAPFSGEGNTAGKADLDELYSGRWSYVGLSNQGQKGKKAAVYGWIFSEYMPRMKEHKIRLHGWAMASVMAIQRQPWASVDSTKWNRWGRWKSICHWDANSRTVVEEYWQSKSLSQDVRNQMRREWLARAGTTEAGSMLDDAELVGLREGIAELDDFSVDLFNAYQWSKLQAYMEQDTTRAYWLSDDERFALISAKRKVTGADLAPQSEFSGALQLSAPVEPGALAVEGSHRGLTAPELEIGRYCNVCVVADKCPKFGKDAACTVSFLRPIQTTEELVAACQDLLAVQLNRAHFAAFVERLQGGFPDPNVTGVLVQFLEMAERIKRLGERPMETLEVKAKGQGIISKLFGSLLQGRDSSQPDV